MSMSSAFKQPRSVWAVAFACVVSFMGIGLVDPILPTMSAQLHASPAQVSLLFTSYLLVTSVAMLITGWVSSRVGAKKTLVVGLILIVLFSAAAGLSGGVDGIIGFRAGWGLGNALFIATSLAVIVGAASGGFEGAIILYEASVGLGIALGPLVGGILGGISWRGPFFGVAVLMAIALISVLTLLSPTPKPAERSRLSAPLKALRNRGLLTVSITALLYNWGFFTILGYAPYPMKVGVHQLGFVFFGWGVLVAIFAVFVAPRAERLIGTAPSLYITLLVMSIDITVMAIWVGNPTVVMVCTIVSGACIGMNNTLVTATVMSVAPVPRPVASAAYSFVRFLGGGLAPWVAGLLAAHFDDHIPFYLGAGAVFLGMLVLATAHRLIGRAHEPTEAEAEELLEATEGNVVHGHLHEQDGSPVSGATLTLIDRTGRQVARGVSGSDGYYTVTGPKDGEYVLIVSALGRQPEACPIGLHGADLELSLALGGASSLRGTVHAAGTGAPLPGAGVTLVNENGEVTAAQRTDTHGRYRFAAVTPGTYTLAANAAGARPVVRAVRVPEAGDIEVDIDLRTHAPVQGVARGTDGHPVAEAMVSLVDDHGRTLARALTDQHGRYYFPDVPTGRYTVIATGYPPAHSAVTVDGGRITSHDITLGHETPVR